MPSDGIRTRSGSIAGRSRKKDLPVLAVKPDDSARSVHAVMRRVRYRSSSRGPRAVMRALMRVVAPPLVTHLLKLRHQPPAIDP